MSRKPWPEQWRSLLEPKFRSRHALADRAGVSVQTVVRLVDGIGEPSPETVQAVADALGVDVDVVLETAGLDRSDHGPFVLPGRASQLTDIQRRAILAVVHAMLSPKRDEVMGDDREPAPIVRLPKAASPIGEAARVVADAHRTSQSESRKAKRRAVTNE